MRAQRFLLIVGDQIATRRIRVREGNHPFVWQVIQSESEKIGQSGAWWAGSTNGRAAKKCFVYYFILLV